MNLLPYPRWLKRSRGTFTLAKGGRPEANVKISRSDSAPAHPEGYALNITPAGIEIVCRENGGLRAAIATFRQLLNQYGFRLPYLSIRDWPDFTRRGVLLDVSRGRVPKLETLLELAGHLAEFKINELQLYTEHTFAYRNYRSVWQSWGALTGDELRQLDARCRQLGIDLVPNQNSFGHLRHLLENPKLRKLAEIAKPYEDEGGEFVRQPSTLAPNHPGALPFLNRLYAELLPNFSSGFFNVGCDETWDLGRGRSQRTCQRLGRGRVYLNFLKQIHRAVSARGKTMMIWGDIILKYPELIPELTSFGVPPSGGLSIAHPSPPKGGTPNLVALDWGYEANHPFEKEAAQFAKARIPFYVCPGSSTWQSLIGRHDNALANLRAAAKAGKDFGAIGYLICDWGDGGHPQPLAVSYLPYLAGASLSWCAKTFDEKLLAPVLTRDVFRDAGIVSKVALALGLAHRKLKVQVPNETPLGTVIAAPPPAQRELFCRNGLKHFRQIPGRNIRAALNEIEAQRRRLRQAKPATQSSRLLVRELDLAAQMAAQSCKFMLWQQAVASGNSSEAKRRAQAGVRELRKLDEDFNAYWPLRNKATAKHCSAFLKWRSRELRQNPE